MQVVQLPDGTFAHFEDGMSPEELRGYVGPDVPDALLDKEPAPGGDQVPLDLLLPGQPAARRLPGEIGLAAPAGLTLPQLALPSWTFYPLPQDGGEKDPHKSILAQSTEHALDQAQPPNRDPMPSDRPMAVQHPAEDLILQADENGVAISPPGIAPPGSREYADWARDAAFAGLKLPDAGGHSLANVRDVESSLLDPFVHGLHYGWSDEARGAVQGALAAAQGGDYQSTYTLEQDEARAALEHERFVNPWGSLAAEIGGGLITTMLTRGKAPAGASVPQRAMVEGLWNLGQGAIYGAGAADGNLEDRAKGAALIGALGGVLGTAAPVVGQAVKRTVSPNPAPAERVAAAQVMKKEGVTALTAGQATGNKGLQSLESELGSGRAAQLMEQQAEQFTQAALKRAGVPAKRATPEVIDETFANLGRQFEDIAMQTNVPFDDQLQDSLLTVATVYANSAGKPAPIVEQLVNRTAQLAHLNGDRVTGEVYQAIRSEIGKYMGRVDGAGKEALRELQDALDDAVERNMSGGTLEEWQHLRRLYQNLLVVQSAATSSAGKSVAADLITPLQLREATKEVLGRGRNDFTDLANAAIQTMTPLPQSATPTRLAAQAMSGLAPALGTAIGSPGGVPGGVAGALAGAALGGVTPWAVGRALLSAPGRAYLGNQWATGSGPGVAEQLIRYLSVPALGSTSQ